MIILPPEERKPSRILKWIFRTLMAVVILFVIMLCALNIISGTSDAHRHGLEQAFSDIFKGRVLIGKLHSFNVFPQFYLDMEDVRAFYGVDGTEFQAEHVIIAFSFADILMKRKTIENLQVTNLTMTRGVIGDENLTLPMAGISPTKDGQAPAFVAQGTYGGVPVMFHLELEPVVGAIRPSYRIGLGRPTNLVFGDLNIDGKFGHTKHEEPVLADAVIKLKDREIAKGQLSLLGGPNQKTIQIDFEGSGSKGQFSYIPSQHQQVWSFETLGTADIMGAQPLWADLYSSYQTMVVAKPGTADAIVGDQISISIKSLSGEISGEALQGHFLHTPGQLVGWWEGKLTTLPETKEKKLSAGQVQCALIYLSETESKWSTKDALIQLDPVMIRSRLALDVAKGTVDFGIERIAGDMTETFGIDLGFIAKAAPQLKFAKDHACTKLVGVEAPAP